MYLSWKVAQIVRRFLLEEEEELELVGPNYPMAIFSFNFSFLSSLQKFVQLNYRLANTKSIFLMPLRFFFFFFYLNERRTPFDDTLSPFIVQKNANKYKKIETKSESYKIACRESFH